MKQIKTITAMSAYAMAGNTPLVVQPMIVGALVYLRGFTERQAGIVAAVELTGLSLGILCLISAVGRVKRSSFAVLAVSAIVAASDAATCFVTQFQWLLPLRFLSGVGAASAFCISSSLASSSARPENSFAIMNAICIAYSGVLTLLSSSILQAYGLPGIMLTLSFITLLALLVIPWISPQVTSAGPAAVTDARGKLPLAIPLPVIALLAMMLMLYTGHGAIWAFQERIGVAAGLTEQAVGKSLGMSMLLWGVGGSLLARLLSLSLGRIVPQVISLGASFIAVLLLVFGTTPVAFATSSGLIALSWFYGLPYQMGLLAAHDPKGRAALAGTMMSTAGMAAGPGIAAFLLVGRAHWPIGVFAGICYLCALAIALPSARSVARMADLRAA